MVSQGQSVADAVRAIGVTEVTYYRWRQEYGGLKSDQVKRLKDLEAENARYRQLNRRVTRIELSVWHETNPRPSLRPPPLSG